MANAMGSTLRVLSPAKINLTLRIVRKRNDGFHDIESLMSCIGLSDVMTFAPVASGEITLTCKFLNRWDACETYRDTLQSEENLAIKAAKLLKKHANISRGVRITLHKKIPNMAGLGGGSSNAATTLMVLNKLWNAGLSMTEISQLAATLGSDIPFFVESTGAAVCRLKGEQVEQVTWPFNYPVVLVKPFEGISTKELYAKCTPKNCENSTTKIMHGFKRSNLDAWRKNVYNDFSEIAKSSLKQVDTILQELCREAGTVSSMTGSGSTCFAICSNNKQAHQLAGKFKAHGQYQVFLTRLQANSPKVNNLQEILI